MNADDKENQCLVAAPNSIVSVPSLLHKATPRSALIAGTPARSGSVSRSGSAASLLSTPSQGHKRPLSVLGVHGGGASASAFGIGGLKKLGGAVRVTAKQTTLVEDEDDDDEDELPAPPVKATVTPAPIAPVVVAPAISVAVDVVPAPITPAPSVAAPTPAPHSHSTTASSTPIHTTPAPAKRSKANPLTPVAPVALSFSEAAPIAAATPVASVSVAAPVVPEQKPLSPIAPPTLAEATLVALAPTPAPAAPVASLLSAPSAASLAPAASSASAAASVPPSNRLLKLSAAATQAPRPKLMSAKPLQMHAVAPASSSTPPPLVHSAPSPVPAPAAASSSASHSSSPPSHVNTVTPPPQEHHAKVASNIIYSAVTVRTRHSAMLNGKETTRHGFLLKGEEFTKLRTIGKGGSSLVYQVCSAAGVLFALKEMTLPAENADDGSSSQQHHIPDYVSEVANMHALAGSPYVAQLHLVQVDTSAQRIYMLMEPGSCDLEQHLSQLRSDLSSTPFAVLLPAYTVRHLWSQMLRCVQAAHAKGIIHTDLKPVNFILGAERGTLKLIDFGIAKAVDLDAGATSALYDKPIGTINYMSPESLNEATKIRSSTDIWSLGCILYSWIYGEAPFARFAQLPSKMHAISNPRQKIHLPSTVSYVEKVLSAAEAADKSPKGNGVHVHINEKDGSCTVTKTHRAMPSHLIGLPLPHRTERPVGAQVRDVLRACLQRKPETRPTADQLLAHPFSSGGGGDEIAEVAAPTPSSSSSTPSPEQVALVASLQSENASLRAREEMTSRAMLLSFRARQSLQTALLQLVDKVCQRQLDRATRARVNFSMVRMQ